MTWDPAGYGPGGTPGFGPIGHLGPVALVVETGTLDLRESDQAAFDLLEPGGSSIFLAPDSSVWIPAGTLYSAYYPTYRIGAAATAFVVGVVPNDEQWFVPVPFDFVSSAYGYGLSWDYPWQVTGKSRSNEGTTRYGWLRLQNGTSWVDIEDFAGYGGSAVQCLDDLINRLESDPTVIDLRPEQRNGRTIEERDADGAYAEFAYTITDANGSPLELVKHIECRTLAPDVAVIVIHAYMPRNDLDVQRQALEELLAGLVLP